jgi:subtilisin-like proprotein convertase family protein
MKKHMLATLIAFSSLATSAVAQDLPSWMNERRIIGDNNLEPIEATIGSDAYDKSKIVARVETIDGSGFCTGSRIAEDLFLTNYHCWEFKPCEAIQFHMGYERDLPADQHEFYKCVEVLAKYETYDYAVFRVERITAPSGTSETFNFADVNLDVPDNDTAGVTKTFDISLDKTIKNIIVNLKATHAYVGDLQVVLKTPDGTAATLHDRAGGSGTNLDVTLTGSVALSAFIGKSANGTWTLEAKDLAAQDIGKIDALSIEIFYADGESTEVQLESNFPVATLWAGEIVVDQPLIVASHPAARLKEIDRSDACKLATVVPEEVGGRQTITHTCDTEGGSSGSPVIDRSTGYVVALHWGGETTRNFAIPMKFVVEHMKSNVAAAQFNKINIQR